LETGRGTRIFVLKNQDWLSGSRGITWKPLLSRQHQLRPHPPKQTNVSVWYHNRGPGENHWPVGNHWQTLSHNVVYLSLMSKCAKMHVFVIYTWRVYLSSDFDCFFNEHKSNQPAYKNLIKIWWTLHKQKTETPIFAPWDLLFGNR
jgi:hypothetical protein